jgi:hypothetical protein
MSFICNNVDAFIWVLQQTFSLSGSDSIMRSRQALNESGTLFFLRKKKKKFSRVRHWTQFWPRQMHVTTLQPSSSQYILLLLLLLVLLLLLRSRLYVVNALFLSGLLINVLYAYLISSKWYTRPAKLCLIVIVLIGKILMLLRTSFSPFAKTQCSTQHIILRRFQYLSYWGLETKCHTRLSQQEKLQFAIF